MRYNLIDRIIASTALMLATRGNYTKVVEVLLSYQPNVNLVDNNGLSALGISAREVSYFNTFAFSHVI